MSTILKALRRLEEERGAQSQRPLREAVTRGAESTKSRRRGWPLLAALLGLGVAAGAGSLTFWYMSPAPEPAEPTQLAAAGSAEPTQLATAGSAEPPAKPAAATKGPSRPRKPRPGRQRPSAPPAAAPSAASERELPAAALTSKVELVKRPPAQPRIAAGEPAEPLASERASSAPPGPLDPAETPGREKRPASRSARSASAPAPSIAARTEAPGPPAPVGAEEKEPRAEQPLEAASESLPVAVAPGPERAAPEPAAASEGAPARDAERRAAAPKPTYEQAAAEGSSKEPAKSTTSAAGERELGQAASSEVVRAEIPSLRVERTVWHPIAERRVATIEFDQSAERREIHEGDAVGPLVVSEIEPSGVVFVHEGIELRRRVGE